MSDVVRIKLYVETGFAGCEHTDMLEVDRAEWEAMTPEEQAQFLDAEAVEFRNNHIGCSAWVMGEGEEV